MMIMAMMMNLTQYSCLALSLTNVVMSVPLTRLRAIDDSFPVAAAEAWNSLPAEVTSAQSLQTFKSKLKTHLFFCLILVVFLRPTPLL